MRLTSIAAAGGTNHAAVSSAVGRASRAGVDIAVGMAVERAVDTSVFHGGKAARRSLLHKLRRLDGTPDRCDGARCRLVTWVGRHGLAHSLVTSHASVDTVVLHSRAVGVVGTSMRPLVGSQGDLALGVVSRGDLAARGSTASVVKARDLGLNATAVGSCSDLRQNRPNRLNEAIFLMRRGILQGSLDNIVGKRVSKEALHLLGNQELFDNHVARGGLGTSKALLNYVGTELVARELADATLEGGNNRFSKGRLVQVDDVLDNVVAKGVLDKNASVLCDPLDEPKLLVTSSVVDAALQNTASVSVCSNLNTVVANCIKDELGINGSELVEALLNDMVAVEILDQFHDAEPEGLDDDVNLLRQTDILNHLLEGACAMLVQGDTDHVLR